MTEPTTLRYITVYVADAIKSALPGSDDYLSRDYGDYGWLLYETDASGKPVRLVGDDMGEPEDKNLVRHFKWTVEEMNTLRARVEELERALAEAKAERDRALLLWRTADRFAAVKHVEQERIEAIKDLDSARAALTAEREHGDKWRDLVSMIGDALQAAGHGGSDAHQRACPLCCKFTPCYAKLNDLFTAHAHRRQGADATRGEDDR